MTDATETQATMSDADSQAPATNWMVGVDGSHDAAAALRWAVSMVEGTGAGVVPVCAWHVPLPIFALAGRRVADVDRMGLRATAEVAASETIDLVGASEVVGELLVVEGHPSDALLELTGPGQVVVVGRRGISEIRHRVLGSVSRDLATHAAGPVVIVPDTWEQRPCRSIVVGFDGSEHAQAALRWAIQVAPPSFTVSALMAIDVIPWLKPELVVERHPEYVESAEQRIRAAADAVDPDGRAERTVVLHGPRQALADVMSEADLVVLGPRGLGGVGRAVLGSVTTWMLHECPCPVAVVPS